MSGGGKKKKLGSRGHIQGQNTPSTSPKPNLVKEELTQHTKSDTNVPVDNTGTIGSGGIIQGDGDKSTPPEQPQVDSCQIEPFKTSLSSVDTNAISLTVVGQTLKIDTVGNEVHVYNTAGKSCGVILSNARKLAQCIARGRRFKAQVASVSGAALDVIVSNF